MGVQSIDAGMFASNYNDVAGEFLKLASLRPNRPDLQELTRLMQAFGRLPYENLTKIIRAHEFEEIDGKIRTPEIVFNDHLEFGTGGTCFSLTYFFEQVLMFSGFSTARVLCDRSYGENTHCALVVDIGQDRYLVDPGYLMQAPLLIPKTGETVQNGKISSVRLVRLGNTSQFLLFTSQNGKTKLRYRLKDIPVSFDDFKLRWIDSFKWAMMRHPCVSRLTDSGQLFMRDGVLRFKSQDVQSQESIKSNFSDEVRTTFGINSAITKAAIDCMDVSLRVSRTVIPERPSI